MIKIETGPTVWLARQGGLPWLRQKASSRAGRSVVRGTSAGDWGREGSDGWGREREEAADARAWR
jgi:hypothetical protein